MARDSRWDGGRLLWTFSSWYEPILNQHVSSIFAHYWLRNENAEISKTSKTKTMNTQETINEGGKRWNEEKNPQTLMTWNHCDISRQTHRKHVRETWTYNGKHAQGKGGKKKRKKNLACSWLRKRYCGDGRGSNGIKKKKKGKTDNAPYVTLSAGPVFQHVKIIRAAVTHYISWHDISKCLLLTPNLRSVQYKYIFNFDHRDGA